MTQEIGFFFLPFSSFLYKWMVLIDTGPKNILCKNVFLINKKKIIGLVEHIVGMTKLLIINKSIE